jgi:hypothetical protein
MTIDDEPCTGDQLAAAPSPGGKFVAVLCEERLKIVDPAAAKVVAERSLDSLRDRDFIRLLGATLDLSHIECFGLAWSPDGTRLAVVLQSGLNGYLVCLDARTGATQSQRVLRTRNLQSDFGELRHASNNRVDWTADSSAILLGGTQLYDAATGKELFQMAYSAREGDQPRRVIRPWDVLTLVRNADGNFLLATFALPKEALAKAVEQVRGAGEAIDALLPPLTAARHAGARTVAPQPQAAWRPVFDDRQPPPARWPDAIELPEPANDVRRVRFASPASGKLALLASSAVSDGKGTTTRTTRLQQIDAVTKEAGPAIVVGNAYALADVSPDGELALLTLGEGTRAQRLDLIGLNPKKHVAAWRPYSDEDPIASAAQDDRPRNVEWSALVDGRHAFTLNEAGRLILWKLPECYAIYQMTGVERLCAKDFSPGRKHLALRAGGRLLVLESLSGACYTLPAPPDAQEPTRCVFRADGKEVWAWYGPAGGPTRIRRIDASTGTQLGEFVQAFQPFSSNVACCELFRGDNVALLGGTTLVDLARNVLLWRYDAVDQVRPADNSPDHRLWYFYDDPRKRQAARLIAVDPYRDEVRSRCAELQAEEQFWLRPGDKVRLAIDIAGARLGPEAAQIEAAVRARLKTAGLVEDPSAATTVSVTGFERDEPKTFTRSDGRQITVSDIKIGVRVAIVAPSGQAVFSFEAVNPPVIDLSQPLPGQVKADPEAKKRELLVDMLTRQGALQGIPGALLKDPRDILPGESLLGPTGPEPMPEDRRLPRRQVK